MSGERLRFSEWHQSAAAAPPPRLRVSSMIEAQWDPAGVQCSGGDAVQPSFPQASLADLRQLAATLRRDLAMDDLQWWCSLQDKRSVQEHEQLSVQECTVVRGDVVAVLGTLGSAEGVVAWINASWLHEQHRCGRQLALLHPTFSNLPPAEITPHLVDLLRTYGCTLCLHRPIRVDAKTLIATRFLVEFP